MERRGKAFPVLFMSAKIPFPFSHGLPHSHREKTASEEIRSNRRFPGERRLRRRHGGLLLMSEKPCQHTRRAGTIHNPESAENNGPAKRDSVFHAHPIKKRKAHDAAFPPPVPADRKQPKCTTRSHGRKTPLRADPVQRKTPHSSDTAQPISLKKTDKTKTGILPLSARRRVLPPMYCLPLRHHKKRAGTALLRQGRLYASLRSMARNRASCPGKSGENWRCSTRLPPLPPC